MRYKSKAEIYRDFDLAVKFRLKHDVGEHRYKEFFEALKRYENWKIEEFSREVRHIHNHYTTSVGLAIEIPVQDGDKTIGVKCVILEHESGPEFFFKLVSFMAKPLLHRMMKAIRDHWPSVAQRYESPIWYVELRSERKGTARIRFEDFEPTQLTCLAMRWAEINRIFDTQESCFEGKLFEPDAQGSDDGI